MHIVYKHVYKKKNKQSMTDWYTEAFGEELSTAV